MVIFLIAEAMSLEEGQDDVTSSFFVGSKLESSIWSQCSEMEHILRCECMSQLTNTGVELLGKKHERRYHAKHWGPTEKTTLPYELESLWPKEHQDNSSMRDQGRKKLKMA